MSVAGQVDDQKFIDDVVQGEHIVQDEVGQMHNVTS